MRNFVSVIAQTVDNARFTAILRHRNANNTISETTIMHANS